MTRVRWVVSCSSGPRDLTVVPCTVVSRLILDLKDIVVSIEIGGSIGEIMRYDTVGVEDSESFTKSTSSSVSPGSTRGQSVFLDRSMLIGLPRGTPCGSFPGFFLLYSDPLSTSVEFKDRCC